MTAFRLALCFFVAVSAIAPCSSDHLIWIQRSPSADPLYRFIKGDKFGYIDSTGKVVIPPTFRYLGGNHGAEFHDGLLEIAVSDGVYVDKSGKKVIDKGFHRGWDFSEGLAVANRKEERKWGYIDTTGEFAISPRFDWSPNDYVWPFQDGYAKIKVAGKFGYIDRSGEFVIPPKFLEAESFRNGMARVIVDGPCVYFNSEGPCSDTISLPGTGPASQACKQTFIDKSGRIITDQRYDDTRDFAEGLAPVKVGSFWGYIDEKGMMVIPPRFDKAAPFADGLALVSENDKYGFIDHAGAYVARPSWAYAESFSEGRAVVGDRYRYWYIDHDGGSPIPGKFARASSFFKGLAHVMLLPGDPGTDESAQRGTFAYIDTNGKRVFVYSP